MTSRAPGAEQAHAGGALSPVRTRGDAPDSLGAVTDDEPRILDPIAASQVSEWRRNTRLLARARRQRSVFAWFSAERVFGSPGWGRTRHRTGTSPSHETSFPFAGRVRGFCSHARLLFSAAHTPSSVHARLLGSNHVSEFSTQLFEAVHAPGPAVRRCCCLLGLCRHAGLLSQLNLLRLGPPPTSTHTHARAHI